jgi:glycosyltransferase involved in cell wall biosynthesis
MPNKFILIEHAMRNLGGHYYTYATSVLEAAERAGFQPVLATHQDFSEFDAFPSTWQVHALFPRRSQWLHMIADNKSKDGFFLAKWWRQWNEARRTHRRLRRTKEFADACTALFQRVPLQPGDHVLIATASDLDFYALTRYLHEHPSSTSATWHLQFHHAIFKGRDPDYPSQLESTNQLRTLFSEALKSVANHRIRFYCTTDELVRQYLLLNIAKFESIPYAIHSIFHRRERQPTQGPLQIACLGQIRPEKGDSQLPAIIEALWDSCLKPGRATLLLQSSEPELREALAGQITALANQSTQPKEMSSPLQFASFPLALNEYADLVHRTDIGLLLYDSDIYFARCSGLLLEMLIAGKPVIVPAGCWLSEQIAAETQRHLQTIGETQSVTSQLEHAALTWADNTANYEFDVTPKAKSMLIGFRWVAPNDPGRFARITVEQFNHEEKLLHTSQSVLSNRSSNDQLRVLIPFDSTTKQLRLSWRSEWQTQPLAITNVECRFLSTLHPAGSIGLVSTSVESLPELLSEIIANMDHYRKGAANFGAQLSEHHHGDAVIRKITAHLLHHQHVGC